MSCREDKKLWVLMSPGEAAVVAAEQGLEALDVQAEVLRVYLPQALEQEVLLVWASVLGAVVGVE